MSNLKKYLFWFANEHLDFRFNEIKSIASLLNVFIKWCETPAKDPFWIVELESDEAVGKIASRSVTLRYVIDLWAAERSTSALHSKLRSLPQEFLTPYQNLSFKMKVELFGSSQSQKEKVDKIESFNYLPLEGEVRLKNPELSLQYVEYYAVHDNKIPQNPDALYFGRVVCEGQRELISKHSLKKRKFIGNTSMDPQLSLIMANQARVSSGDFILDPFVGSGSVLVAAAEYGGYVLGADIDYLMIHGKSRPTRKQDREKPRQNESILTNMKEYGLADRYVDIVVADSSLPLWRPGLVLDAIITDPPYGMREAMERIGCTREGKKISDEHLRTHIPSKVGYSLSQLLADLLHFSASYLKIGGFLVFWIPVIRCEYSEESLPSHSCLNLIGNSEQVLSTASSRRLLTYQKIKDQVEEPVQRIDENEETFRQRYYKYVEELKKSKSYKGKE